MRHTLEEGVLKIFMWFEVINITLKKSIHSIIYLIKYQLINV